MSSGNRISRGGQSAFHTVMRTPSMILTPKGDQSQSMILLSPSRTIGESLTTLASGTAHQLEEIWDEVGYNPEERASQLSDLLVKFRDLCEAKVAEERGVAETFRQTIADAKEELKTTAKALKTLVDPELLRDDSGLTLTDELEQLETALEGIRNHATEAREDLKECRDQIIEAHEALGIQEELDTQWRDIESDLTAERREQFHRKRVEMKEELHSRTSAVIQLLRSCQHVMHELRIETDQSGTEFDRQIDGSLVRSKDGSFIMASKFQTETCTGISSKAYDQLMTRLEELNGEKRRRKTKLQDMGASIAMLWEKLRIPEEEQRAFTESVQGLGLDTVAKGEAELERLLLLKADMIGKLVAEARETIQSLWEETNATKDQRSSFAPYSVESESLFNDELLEKHEEYIQVLEARLENMKPILKLIKHREEILRERMEYEELQKDPNRLQQRGASMTKQLMREEKMARRIKGLPKLTRDLNEKLHEWKEVNHEDFQYHGEAYLDVMERQEEEWKQYKENELQHKLKKKQEEQTLVESRFGAGSKFKPLPGRKVLSNAQSRQNTTHRAPGDATNKASSRPRAAPTASRAPTH
jgi:protein regulator of cytokinesis 1